jgi:hypothetical protein
MGEPSTGFQESVGNRFRASTKAFSLTPDLFYNVVHGKEFPL